MTPGAAASTTGRARTKRLRNDLLLLGILLLLDSSASCRLYRNIARTIE
jgi:hypothetical protein